MTHAANVMVVQAYALGFGFGLAIGALAAYLYIKHREGR